MAYNYHYNFSSPDLISLATPADEYNEKDPAFFQSPHSQPHRGSSSTVPRPLQLSSSSRSSSHNATSASISRPTDIPPRGLYEAPPFGHQGQSTLSSRFHQNPTQSRSRSPRLITMLKPWLPMILYGLTTAAFIVAIAFYKTELFAFLDELSLWLRTDEYGHAILFFMIFLTTIPPIPLYSTLIVLSGYTFGTWTGAIISYFAALTGALVVFVASRSLFRESIGRWLKSCTKINRVVRAIEKRPKLLFLIRFAPYPYNVLNCLLAAAPTLTLHTYTVCTALSLFKVVIHTSLGASIHSFKDYHATPTSSNSDSADWMAHMWTMVGIALCAAILVYLYIVARRAVDDELDDEPLDERDFEERQSFLSASDLEGGLSPSSSRPLPSSLLTAQPMIEVPFSPMTPYRPSFDVGQYSGSHNLHAWS